MATTEGFLQQADTHQPAPKLGSAARWRPSRGARWLVLAISAVVIGGLGLWAATSSEWLSPSKQAGQALTYKVKRADLVVTVTEDGNLESASNLDLKCEVAGGSTILWLIKDGTQVHKADELVRLDASVIEEQVNAQKILYERAQAARIEAEKVFSASKIAVEEYIEGTYVQALQDVEGKITVAMENLRSAENMLQHTERMARKGYVTALQRDAQAFSVQRSKIDLESAKTSKRVLEKFTKAKTLEDLESKRDTAEAKMHSEQAAFDLEKGKLKRLTTQLEKCVIIAPRDGMVIYANEPGGRPGQQGVQIEEGSLVRERQAIIRLPDLEHMQAKTLVHESRVDSLRPGMRARIHVQERNMQGTVVSVANQAEAAPFGLSSVRKYATIVRIDGDVKGKDLKPGMTAEVEILVANLKDTISVPVQAVVEMGGKSFCWVKTSTGSERRPVVLGVENNTSIEIKDGIAENEDVLLNPRAVAADAREEVRSEQPVDVKKTFGDAPPAGAAPAGGPAAGGAPDAAGGADGQRGAGSAGGRRSGGKRSGFDPMQFDKDGDKKISRDEAPAQMQAFFDTLDENHDGFIDMKEIAAMRRKFGQGGGAPGGGPPAP